MYTLRSHMSSPVLSIFLSVDLIIGGIVTKEELWQDNKLSSLLQPEVVVPIVEKEDASAQRQALRTRAYSAAGRSEGFISRILARMRPTTIAQLQLFANDPSYHSHSLVEGQQWHMGKPRYECHR